MSNDLKKLTIAGTAAFVGVILNNFAKKNGEIITKKSLQQQILQKKLTGKKSLSGA